VTAASRNTDGLARLVETLHAGGHSLVVQDAAGEVHTFGGRGVADLHAILLTNPELLAGASVADKVVGKGAAALMVLGGVARLHADVMSRPALSLLTSGGVETEYGELVPNIVNRAGTGICPVETLCLRCTTAEECLPLITGFLNGLRKQ